MSANKLTLIIIALAFLSGCQDLAPKPPQPEGLYRPINIKPPIPEPVAKVEPEKPNPKPVIKPKKVRKHGK